MAKSIAINGRWMGGVIRAEGGEWVLKYRIKFLDTNQEVVERFKTRREAIQAAFESESLLESL